MKKHLSCRVKLGCTFIVDVQNFKVSALSRSLARKKSVNFPERHSFLALKAAIRNNVYLMPAKSRTSIPRKLFVNQRSYIILVENAGFVSLSQGTRTVQESTDNVFSRDDLAFSLRDHPYYTAIRVNRRRSSCVVTFLSIPSSV